MWRQLLDLDTQLWQCCLCVFVFIGICNDLNYCCYCIFAQRCKELKAQNKAKKYFALFCSTDRRAFMCICFWTEASVMLATHAQETCTRKSCKSSCKRNLVSVNLVQVFVWYKLLVHWAQLYSSTETACDTNCAMWLAGQLLLCKKLWWTWDKLFMQVSCASFFLRKFLVQVFWALPSYEWLSLTIWNWLRVLVWLAVCSWLTSIGLCGRR